MTSEDREQTRTRGGDLWEGVLTRRAAWQLIVVESLLIAVVGWLFATVTFEWETPNAIAFVIALFFGVLVLMSIPIVGGIIGLVLSVCWGLIGYAVGSQFSLALGIVVGIVLLLGSLGLHLGLKR